jgi:hypothetical protein
MTQDTITRGLGIPDNWLEELNTTLEDIYINTSTVSDMMIETGKRIKEEEFGTVNIDHQISIYERKLILSGMMIGHLIDKARDSQHIESIIKAILQGGLK